MTTHDICMFISKIYFTTKSKNIDSHVGDMTFQLLDGTPQ